MYLDQNNLDAAATYIDALLQLNKADVTSRLLTGRLRLAQQQVAEAITILQKVVQERPNLALAQYTLGLAYRQQQRFPQAKTAFAEAIKLAPNAVAPHLALGTLYLQDGAFDLAVEEGRRILTLQRSRPRRICCSGKPTVARAMWPRPYVPSKPPRNRPRSIQKHTTN